MLDSMKIWPRIRQPDHLPPSVGLSEVFWDAPTWATCKQYGLNESEYTMYCVLSLCRTHIDR